VLPEKLLIYGIEEGDKESSERWYSQLVEMLHQDMAV
jgi:hypothetical protein